MSIEDIVSGVQEEPGINGRASLEVFDVIGISYKGGGLLSKILGAITNNTQISKEELMQVIANQLLTAPPSETVKNSYLSAVNSIYGKAVRSVLKLRGYNHRDPDLYVELDLPSYIGAATITTQDGRIILAHNRNRPIAGTNTWKELYYNLHEYGHVAGINSESQTDGTVGDAFGELASRAKNTAQDIYGGLSKAPAQFQKWLYTLGIMNQYAKERETAQANL